MRCPNCGTENQITSNRKFCVKCGTNLINPDDVNIEQIDFGGYHTEEKTDNFKIGSGTFKINDKVPQTQSMFVSSEELNESYDDFSSEPYIPQLDSERVKVPEQPDNINNNVNNMPNQNGMPQYNNPNMYAPGGMNPNMMYPQNGMNPYMQNMYGYGQPMMQTQFVGYDTNGMPVYTQVMMMPQFVGYDMNGMPMYMPMPVYPQSNPQPNPQFPQNMQPNPQFPQNIQPNPQFPQNMQPNPQFPQNIQPNPQFPQNIQPNPQNSVYNSVPKNMSQKQPVPVKNQEIPEKPEKKESLWSDFLEEDIKKSTLKDESEKAGSDDDFFSRPQRSKNMNGVSAEGLDLSQLERRKPEKKNKYMSSAPEADASQLVPNPNKNGNKYMKSTAVVNADNLEQNVTKKSKVKMKKTLEANPDELEQYVKKAPEVIMGKTKKADASELPVYQHEHVEAIMAGADHAVEAMPKKKVYVDELDKIELPEHMKAKKSKGKTVEIPSLPDIKK